MRVSVAVWWHSGFRFQSVSKQDFPKQDCCMWRFTQWNLWLAGSSCKSISIKEGFPISPSGISGQYWETYVRATYFKVLMQQPAQTTVSQRAEHTGLSSSFWNDVFFSKCIKRNQKDDTSIKAYLSMFFDFGVFFPFTWFSTCFSPVWHAGAAVVGLVSVPLLAKAVYLVQTWLKYQLILFQSCAIPFLARLQSSEAKLWKVQSVFDGRWKGNIG